jgi:pyruvate dehydrogenase E2 component (dihydrolipoamide acetyltransferase)
MAIPVELPKLGNTVEECIISKWMKHSGDHVDLGETVLEVETDKAVQEIASTAAGTLLATFFDEGSLVPVFTNLFVIGEVGESPEPFRPQSASGQDTVKAATAHAASSPSPTPFHTIAAQEPDHAAQGSFSPRARRFAQEHDFHPKSVPGSGPGGRVLEEDVRALYLSSPRISGAARKQIESGLESPDRGSGIGGSVLAVDLVPATQSPRTAATKLSNIRTRIAQRMRESITSTAQYTLNASADAGGLLILRARIKASTGMPDANINDMVMFCTVQALLEVPDLNVDFIDGKIVKHSEVHLGIAVDTPRGLMVPVIRDAHKLSLGELAGRAKELSAKAGQGSISPDDLTGATFSVSNLGGLGIESFTPILTPPQVAILGVNAIQIKPIRRDGIVQFIDAIGLSLTLDHQIIDGAPGARFLRALKEKIEKVESICAI